MKLTHFRPPCRLRVTVGRPNAARHYERLKATQAPRTRTPRAGPTTRTALSAGPRLVNPPSPPDGRAASRVPQTRRGSIQLGGGSSVDRSGGSGAGSVPDPRSAAGGTGGAG